MKSGYGRVSEFLVGFLVGFLVWLALDVVRSLLSGT